MELMNNYNDFILDFRNLLEIVVIHLKVYTYSVILIGVSSNLIGLLSWNNSQGVNNVWSKQNKAASENPCFVMFKSTMNGFPQQK